MYKAALTGSAGDSFRPWQTRLGDYNRATFYVPTPTVAYGNQPVTGGLGLDLSTLTTSPLFWLGAAAAGWWAWKKWGRR
jgi:hypothetical protein